MGMSSFDYASYVDRIQTRRSRSFYDADEEYDSWWLQKEREKEERQHREYEEKERIRKEKEKQRIINSYPKFRILFIDGFRNEHAVGNGLFDTFKEAYEEMKFLIEYDLFPRWYNKPFNSYITPPHKENVIIQQVEYGWNTSIVYNRLKGDNDMVRLVGKGDQYIDEIDY